MPDKLHILGLVNMHINHHQRVQIQTQREGKNMTSQIEKRSQSLCIQDACRGEKERQPTNDRSSMGLADRMNLNDPQHIYTEPDHIFFSDYNFHMKRSKWSIHILLTCHSCPSPSKWALRFLSIHTISTTTLHSVLHMVQDKNKVVWRLYDLLILKFCLTEVKSWPKGVMGISLCI